jgi:Leucine-rich repeat (LRR) protein
MAFDMYWYELENILEEIIQLPQLQAVKVDFASPDKKAKQFLRNLHKLPNLRFLTLNYAYREDFGEINIKGLPKLQHLQIQMEATVELLNDLPALETLIIYRAKVKPDEMLEKLNPQKLTSLALRGVGKHKNTNPAPTNIAKFKELKFLNLSDNRLKTLEFSLQDLPALEHLDISENGQFVLTKDFIFLDNLQKLGISDTKTVKQQYLKTGKDLLQIIKDCKEKKATPEQREQIFEILQNPQQASAKIDLEVWANLYPFVSLLHLHQQLLAVLEKFVTISLTDIYKQKQDLTICVAGKLQGITAKDAKEKFKQFGIKQTNKITEKTDIVCIGERADAEIVAQVMREKSPFCTPFHVKAFLDELETPYLIEAETEVHDNLGNLLQSREIENRSLALQLMKTGGIPSSIFPFLCMELFYDGAIMKSEILALLRKYTTNEQYIFLNNAYKKQNNSILVTTITQLIAGNFGKPEEFAQVLVQYFKPNIDEIFDYYHPKPNFYAKFATRLWKNTDALKFFWETHFDTEQACLDLCWYKYQLKSLPKYFLNEQVKRIKTAVPYHSEMDFILRSWVNLEEYLVCLHKNIVTSSGMAQLKKKLPAHVKLSIVFV